MAWKMAWEGGYRREGRSYCKRIKRGEHVKTPEVPLPRERNGKGRIMDGRAGLLALDNIWPNLESPHSQNHLGRSNGVDADSDFHASSFALKGRQTSNVRQDRT